MAYKSIKNEIVETWKNKVKNCRDCGKEIKGKACQIEMYGYKAYCNECCRKWTKRSVNLERFL